jgi:hypothetical protein
MYTYGSKHAQKFNSGHNDYNAQDAVGFLGAKTGVGRTVGY